MLERFRQNLRNWCHRKKSQVASLPPRRSLLRPLEWLEVREVPADNIWRSLGTDFNDAGNWSDGVPTPDDVLIFQPRLNVGGGLPGEPPPPPVSTSVTFPNEVLSFAGIQINSDYTGTITFQKTIWFGKYLQAGGTVNQEASNPADSPNLTVVVSAEIMWTGGAINGPGTYSLHGADGRIGLDNTTLTSGATFELLSFPVQPFDPTAGMNDAFVEQSGTLNLGGPITVSGGSHLTQRRINPAGARPVIGSQEGLGGHPGIILLNTGGFVTYGGAVPSVFMNGGGVMNVNEGGLEVTGYVPGMYGVRMSGTAKTTIQNGQTLKAAYGVWMENGTLQTRFHLPAHQRAVIDGVFRMDGGTVQLGVNPDQGHVGYSELIVKGMAKLHGGTFKTKLDPANKDNRDAIITDDKLDTRGAFTVLPLNDGAAEGAKVLVSELGFTAESVDPDNPNDTRWEMERAQDGKHWLVKKKP